MLKNTIWSGRASLICQCFPFCRFSLFEFEAKSLLTFLFPELTTPEPAAHEPAEGPAYGPTEGPTEGPAYGPTEGPAEGPAYGPTEEPALEPVLEEAVFEDLHAEAALEE